MKRNRHGRLGTCALALAKAVTLLVHCSFLCLHAGARIVSCILCVSCGSHMHPAVGILLLLGVVGAS